MTHPVSARMVFVIMMIILLFGATTIHVFVLHATSSSALKIGRLYFLQYALITARA